MTRADLLKRAGAAAPELMQKTAAILAQLEMSAPERAEEVSSEISTLVDYVVEKLASPGYGPLARWGAGVASVAAGGVALNMASDLYDVAKRGLTRERNLRAIMKANPELKAVDKARLQSSFSAIHRFAPELTADPLVGGSLLKSVAEVPGNEAVAIKDIINSRKNLLDAKQIDMRAPAIELPTKEDALEEKKFNYSKARDLARDLASTEESLYRRERDARMDAAAASDKAYRRRMDQAAQQLQEARTKAEKARQRATMAEKVEDKVLRHRLDENAVVLKGDPAARLRSNSRAIGTYSKNVKKLAR